MRLKLKVFVILFLTLLSGNSDIMRKIILSIICVFSALAAFAQPRALGVRLSTEWQVSYEHCIGPRGDFLEVDMGYELIQLVNLAAAYDFMIARPQWTSRGEWGFYAGPATKIGGAGLGFYLALGAQVGLEYTFDFPLQISLDMRPAVGAAFVSGSVSFYGGGVIFGGIPSLSIRYRFGE